MKRILFPTEFSKHAPDVFQYALEIALRFDAKIVILNALGITEDSLLQTSLGDEKISKAMDSLLSFVEEHKNKKYESVDIEYTVDPDYAVEAIKKISEQEMVDLIVMGMTGRGTTAEKLFGSVTTSVLENSGAPVLVVPAGQKYRWMQNIIYATDFTFSDIGVLSYLRKMARAFNTEIDCLHVVREGESVSQAKFNMAILADAFTGKYFADFDVVEGDFITQVSQYLKYDDSNILVMLTRKKKLWSLFTERSLTKEVVRKINRPILVFKEEKYEELGWTIDLSSKEDA